MFEKAEFIKAVRQIDQIGGNNKPEIVLCGRSNVGKSSFINTVLQRKNLAHTSSSPGKTKSLNYYLIDDKFYFVDLPGYGYAKVSKKEREFWKKLIEAYFSGSKNIKAAFHFVDSRISPTDLDAQLKEYIDRLNLPYFLILTKVDKLKQSELAKTKKRIGEFFPSKSIEETIYFSSLKGRGKKEAINVIWNMFYS